MIDSKGYIYISGNTRDRNFPATEGAFQRELKGEADAFVAKFTPEGRIVFATLVGGTKREHHTGLAVDNDGYVYLVGGTHSADFPVTAGAYDTSFNGEKDWSGDVYLTFARPGSGIKASPSSHARVRRNRPRNASSGTSENASENSKREFGRLRTKGAVYRRLSIYRGAYVRLPMVAHE